MSTAPVPGRDAGGRRWVLVTDGGGADDRSAVAAVRALDEGGYLAAVARSDRHALAAVSRACRRVVDVPAAASPEYRAAVEDELARRPYLTVLPSHDEAVFALAAPGTELLDKAVLADRAAAAGMQVPESTVFDSGRDLKDAAPHLDYPVVVKPRIRRRFSYRHAAYRADHPSQIVPDPGPVLVQPYVSEPIHAVGGVIRGGVLMAAVHQRYLRTWRIDCGEASAAVTTDPDPGLEDRLVSLLEGFEGIFQAQLAGPFLLDLNPRVYGSLPLAVAAGANLVRVWCDLLRGAEVPEVRARPGVRYRWVEGDLRHLWAAARSGRMGVGRALGAMLPRRGTAHSVLTLSDPRPGLLELRHRLRRR